MEPHGSHLTDARSERRLAAILVGVLTIVVLLSAVDVVGDLAGGQTGLHVVIEGLLLGACSLGAALMARRYFALFRHVNELEREAEALTKRLRETKLEAERFRNEARELLGGLGAAIQQQFQRWELTRAEKEVALALLKGLSHKEIAQLRDSGEATVRQQARSVYRKAGLTGRADLSAFFLEDLLLPPSSSKIEVPEPSGAQNTTR